MVLYGFIRFLTVSHGFLRFLTFVISIREAIKAINNYFHDKEFIK